MVHLLQLASFLRAHCLLRPKQFHLYFFYTLYLVLLYRFFCFLEFICNNVLILRFFTLRFKRQTHDMSYVWRYCCTIYMVWSMILVPPVLVFTTVLHCFQFSLRKIKKFNGLQSCTLLFHFTSNSTNHQFFKWFSFHGKFNESPIWQRTNDFLHRGWKRYHIVSHCMG